MKMRERKEMCTQSRWRLYNHLKEHDIMDNRWLRREDAPLKAPNTEGNVWPRQVCPAFEPRADTPDGIRQCWYCRCADFHLDRPRSLDVGVCYWPRKTLK